MARKRCKVKSCPLKAGVEVPYLGDKKARIAFVGESPGWDEEREGKPFVGDSGVLSKELVAEAGLKWADLFIMNAARCRIDKQEMTNKQISATLACCRKYVVQALTLIKPKVIICCGAIALQQVMKKGGIKKSRGTWIWSKEFNCWVMPVYHPAYILRNKGLKPQLLKDLMLVKEFVNSGYQLPEDEPAKYGELESIAHFLTKMDEIDTKDVLAGFDTESQGLDWLSPNFLMLSYQISVKPGIAAMVRFYEEVPVEDADFVIMWPRALPWMKQKEPVEVGIRRLPNFDKKVNELELLLKHPKIKKYMVNGNFDLHALDAFFWREQGCRPEIVSYAMDLQAAAQLLDENIFQQATLTDLQFYFTDMKGDYNGKFGRAYDKGDMLAVPLDAFVDYGCLAKGSRVQMADDSLEAIDCLVKTKSNAGVKSLNLKTGSIEVKPITGWYRNEKTVDITWLSVRTALNKEGRWGNLGLTRYTADHRLLTTKGWVEIGQLHPGDVLITPFRALSEVQHQIVIGGLLGDSSISQRNPTGFACLQMSHSEKQEEYLRWKASFFQGLGGSFREHPAEERWIVGRRCRKSKGFRFQTLQHPQFKEYRDAVYPHEVKSIGGWVKPLSALGLAVWYMDDGCLVDGRSIRLHTDGFTVEDVSSLKRILYLNFGIVADHYLESRSSQPVLSVDRANSPVFFKLVSPFICQELQYKLPKEWRGKGGPVEDKESWKRYETEVVEVVENPGPSSRGYKKVSYCIDVADNHNFLTQNEIAHNCADADSTRRVAVEIRDQLVGKKGNKKLAQYMVKFIMPTLQKSMFAMERTGVWIDKKALPKTLEAVAKDAAKFQAAALKTVPAKVKEAHDKKGLKLTRNVLIADVLFGKDGFKIKPWKKTRGGDAWSTDKEVRKRLLEQRIPKKAVTFIKEFDEWQEMYTLLSRYLKGFERHIKPDGYIHSSLSLTKAVTGRLASSNPNMMNNPKRSKSAHLIRRLIAAPPGWLLMAADEGQAELRWAADLADEKNMKKVFAKGLDIHTETAKELIRRSGKIWSSLSKKEVEKARRDAKCFHPDTEVLTPSGWKKMGSLRHEPIIEAIPGEDGCIELAWTLDYALTLEDNHYDCLAHLKNEGIDLRVTPDHRMLGQRNTGRFFVTSPEEFNKARFWKNAGILLDGCVEVDEQLLRLAVATQADGSFDQGGGIRFGFKKRGKIRRIRSLLRNSGVAFTEHLNAAVTSFRVLKKDAYKVKELLDEDKTLPWNWLELTPELREVVLEEARFWDAHKARNWRMYVYSSIKRKNVDVLQALASVTGLKTRLAKDARDLPENCNRIFRLTVRDTDRSRGGNVAIDEIPYSGKVAVLSVPSSFVLVRDGGIPVITGQSVNFGLLFLMSAWGFVRYCFLEYGLTITENEARGYIEAFFGMYPGLRTYHRKTISFCRQHGYVETVLGRKRRLPEITSSNNRDRGEAERQAVNHRIQSPSSDIVLMAGNEIVDSKPNPEEFKLSLFVHDELVSLVREDANVEMYGRLMKEAMEHPPLERDFGYKMSVPLVADIKVGPNLAEMEILKL